uniref:Uncharacterized protein n=1 Tax=Oryza brachyantha TaxID=4533 RepID=J3MEC9_ORYBR
MDAACEMQRKESEIDGRKEWKVSLGWCRAMQEGYDRFGDIDGWKGKEGIKQEIWSAHGLGLSLDKEIKGSHEFATHMGRGVPKEAKAIGGRRPTGAAQLIDTMDDRTTLEHISQFIAQCGEASTSDALKLRLFPLSLSGTAITWFTALPPNSVHTWSQLEEKFHEYFYTGDTELRLAHLTSVKQKYNEPFLDYIRRFRDTRNRCFSLIISDKDLAELAHAGLLPYLKEKLEGKVQSAINEGRLKFAEDPKMQLDSNPFPVNVIDFENSKVLIRPSQAESTKDKAVIVGQNSMHTVKASSSGASQGSRPRMIKLKSPEIGRWKINESRSRTTKRVENPKPTFKELLAKFEGKAGGTFTGQPSNFKKPRAPPMQDFDGPDHRWEEFHPTPPYPPFGAPMLVPWCPAGYPPYPPWGWYDPWMPPAPMPYESFHPILYAPLHPIPYTLFPPMPFEPFRLGWEEPRRPVFDRLTWLKDDRFNPRKRAHDGRSDKPVEKVYRVKKDGNANKGPDLGLAASNSQPVTNILKVNSTSATLPTTQVNSTANTLLSSAQMDSTSMAGPAANCGGSSVKQNASSLPVTSKQPQWCPPDIGHTRKRKLQRLRAKELRESKAEKLSEEIFNDINPAPALPTKKEWRVKQVEHSVQANSDDEYDLLDCGSHVIKDGSPVRECMDINMVFTPPDIGHTRKRRLQRLRAQELRESKAEKLRERIFNDINPAPALPTKKEWRVKQVEHSVQANSDDEYDLLDCGSPVIKDGSPVWECMDINMVFTLHSEFQVVDEEVAQLCLGPKEAIFEKPDESSRHLRPLYVKGHINGRPVIRMLVDGGATVNLMPYSVFKRMGKEDSELLKTNLTLNGFTGEPTEAKGIISMELTIGSKTLPTTFFVTEVQESSLDWLQKRTEQYRSNKNDICEAIDDFDEVEKLGQGFSSADPLEEVDIGDGTVSKPTFINKNMTADCKIKVIRLLREYVDCFAWEYNEMPGLSRELVEHRLPIKSGFRPYKQPPRRFSSNIYDQVKEEIGRLLKAGFIRPCRYAEWISNIIPVEKKEDSSKTGFRCPGLVGLFEWVVMTFGEETEFTWGTEQQQAFDELKKYLSTPPVLRAPKARVPFRLYIAAEDSVIGAVLTQESEGKECVITYLSRQLLEAEMSTCVVTCQTDVIKYMLQKPILSGRIGKWAYALVEYDLAYEPLKSMKGQIVADFIVDHRINDDMEMVGYLSVCPWKLYFDGLACKQGQGVGIVLVSPRGAIFETSVRMEYFLTNNQAEYEALLLGLQILESMGVRNVEAYGDSLLVVQQISGNYQCFDGLLNVYLERCLKIIENLDYFIIKHICREENVRANDLAQQASGYQMSRDKVLAIERPMLEYFEVNMVESDDWRKPLISYLENPSQTVDRKLRRQALKYTLLDGDLYHRTIDGFRPV